MVPREQTTYVPQPWLTHKETTSHGNQGAICAANLVIFDATALTKGNTTILELTTRQGLKSKTAEDYSDDEMVESVEAFIASVDSTCQMDKWLVDSGASSHMTWERNILTNFRQFELTESQPW